MVLININDRNYIENEEFTILQVLVKKGIEIPRFCYHEYLNIVGNCRICLIEDHKTAKPLLACSNNISSSMNLYTETIKVAKARESVLEYMLINHPLDCPICDEGGECDLQDVVRGYGSDCGRFYDHKRAIINKNFGVLIKTIMNRCIHCTRCVRFAIEITGVEEIGIQGRGSYMEIGYYLNKIFDSGLSGNVIDLCPVGALTSKPYAFNFRA